MFRRPISVMLLLALILVLASPPCVADDEYLPPSEAERNAVAALSAAGASIYLDGRYQIRTVSFSRTDQVTNDTLVHIGALPHVERISISSISAIKDEGIRHLHKLKGLRSVTLRATGVSDEGAAALKKALPDCEVTVSPSLFGSRRGDTRSRAPGGGSRRGDTRSLAPGGRGRTFGGPGGTGRTFGGPGGDRGTSRSRTIRLTYVQTDLRLSTEQKRQVAAVTSTSYRDAELEKDLKLVLNRTQFARFQQVLLQLDGLRALLRHDVVAKLALTDTQVKEIQKVSGSRSTVSRKMMEGLRAPSGDDSSNGRSRFDQFRKVLSQLETRLRDEAFATLNDSQRQTWEKMVGAPIDRTLSFSTTASTDVRGRSYFFWYDVDRDGQLTASEWAKSLSTRDAFESKEVTLEFPIGVDEFVKAFTQVFGESTPKSGE